MAENLQEHRAGGPESSLGGDGVGGSGGTVLLEEGM